jgi:hypothetical protein
MGCAMRSDMDYPAAFKSHQRSCGIFVTSSMRRATFSPTRYEPFSILESTVGLSPRSAAAFVYGRSARHFFNRSIGSALPMTETLHYRGRERRELSMNQLAVRIGRVERSILRYETGESAPDIVDLTHIAEELDCELFELLAPAAED